MFSVAEQSPRGTRHRAGPSRSWYLIARTEGNRLEVLTLAGQPHSDVFPLFTSAGSAWDFLLRGGVGEDWRVRESAAGELVSILVGHLPRVDRVVLDPVFGVSAGDEEPQSTGKKEFISILLGEPLVAPARS